MPKKRKYTAEDLVADMLHDPSAPDPINFAKEVDGMIAKWGFDKGAEEAAKMVDYYRWAQIVDMASDWAEVHRIILKRKDELGS
jgi:hypothetical protein